MARLKDKTALIIGGTHGMGIATAKALLGEGARVMVTGANPNNVEEARRELGDNTIALRSDISSIAELDQLVASASEQLGQLDALFVFAAIAELAPIAAVTEESFDRQFAINTKGAFFTLQRLMPQVKNGGSITMVTVTPSTATPSMGVYTATKSAVRGFSQVLAAELLDRGIRVNCLAPGFIDTPSLGIPGLSPSERREFMSIGDQVTPMRRHGTVDEIAAAALFLGFDATFTTGIELAVDGGLSAVDNPG